MIILMKKEVKLGLVVGGLVLGLGLTYYLATQVVPRAMVTMTKAAPATKVSFKSSLLIGEKILAKADGKEKCIINVFVMDESGKGVAGKVADLSVTAKRETSGEAKAEAVEAMTSKDGKMSFELVSETEGQYVVEANIEGVPLGRSVVVTFRN